MPMSSKTFPGHCLEAIDDVAGLVDLQNLSPRPAPLPRNLPFPFPLRGGNLLDVDGIVEVLEDLGGGGGTTGRALPGLST